MNLFRKMLMISVLSTVSTFAMEAPQGGPQQGNVLAILQDRTVEELATSQDIDLRAIRPQLDHILAGVTDWKKKNELKAKFGKAFMLKIKNAGRPTVDQAQTLINQARENEAKAKTHIDQATDADLDATAHIYDISTAVNQILASLNEFNQLEQDAGKALKDILDQVKALQELNEKSATMTAAEAAKVAQIKQMLQGLEANKGEKDIMIDEIRRVIQLLEGR
ncbi:hypothetical protein [Candidatus Odyssella thessalonicensis]|uniref:hypothetical protein n=1 Tax=Candidatus Odyssella thessalonicensis TaxID=84647 RepID=UPI000225AE9D|nr:hypothetical protein [Candidatus Odyssella thessalonicensis]